MNRAREVRVTTAFVIDAWKEPIPASISSDEVARHEGRCGGVARSSESLRGSPGGSGWHWLIAGV